MRPDQVTAINNWLAKRNGLLEFSVIYAMGADGVTIASGNFDRPDSFGNRNFSFCPYFAKAITVGHGGLP